MFKNPDRPGDPLAALTVQKRIVALREAFGYGRADFARALGVSYSVVVNWDNEKHMPTVPLIRQIADLLQVSTDLLINGRESPYHIEAKGPAQGYGVAEPSVREIRFALDRIGASADARQALTEHMQTPAGQLQLITVQYAIRYCQAYDAERARVSDEAARARAFGAAVNWREAVAAEAAPAPPPVAKTGSLATARGTPRPKRKRR